MKPEEAAELFERARAAFLAAARDAYEDAGIQGLCAEGRWEAALGAIERLDYSKLGVQKKS